MKGLIYGSALAVIVLSFSTLSVQAADVTTPIARIVPAETSFPGSDTPQNATHHLAIAVQSADLSQLVLSLPADVKPPTAVQVTNQAEESVETKVTIAPQKVIINFTQPIAIGTTLEVSLQGVRRVTTANVLVYEVAARKSGAKGLTPIGSASVRAYGPAQQ
ncbi:MAG: DUF2808 domain-containing protein [Lyngbya sp. HA4199-MV5]|jgi:hypothetical protein|nr:DUF2808 domain-containing protein [Lyngbya sp. HA4199-MV5]